MQKQASTDERKSKDIELWEKYKETPGDENLEPLMKQVEPIIQNQVNKWSGAIARPVLEAKAKGLAKEAIDTYDPDEYDAALSTHLTHRLQKLSREVYTHQDAVRIPEYKKRKYQTYKEAKDELKGELGREPTDVELADNLGWSRDKVKQVQQSMNPEYVESEDVGGGMFESNGLYGTSSEDELVDYIYHDLSPQEQVIFEHSTGYSGKEQLSNKELRNKLDLSQGQLSYRKRKIVDKVQDIMEEHEQAGV